MKKRQEEFDPTNRIRSSLMSGSESAWKRYAKLVVGEASILKLLKYEIITTLFGWIPGAFGIWTRKIFFRTLVRNVGSGVVFGRGVVIRNGDKINIGDRVVIDDYCLLDARGAGEEGIVIDHEAIVHRGVMLVAKSGKIEIGENADIGSHSCVMSTGGVHIGKMVAVAGGCKIGGGGNLRVSHEHSDSPVGNDPNDYASRSQETAGYGPIWIGDRCTLFMNAIVLDGVRIGTGAVIGAAVIVRDDVPEACVLALHQKLVLLGRQGREKENDGDSSAVLPFSQMDETSTENSQAQSTTREAIIEAVYAAIDEINQMREEQIERSLIAPLAGQDGSLDSMDVVNLIVEIEQQVQMSFGRTIDLSDVGVEKLSSVGTLVDRIESRLSDAISK